MTDKNGVLSLILDGQPDPTNPPVKRGSHVLDISCGDNHLLARLKDKKGVYVASMAVGQCNKASLGRTGRRLDSLMPVGSLTGKVIDISAGPTHSMALKTDGTLMVFGDYCGSSYDEPTPCWGGLQYQNIITGDGFAIARPNDSLYMMGEADKEPIKLDFSRLIKGSLHKVVDVSVEADRACCVVELSSDFS